MAHSLSLGVFLTLLAGLMAGNCMLPMKFNRNWQWENTWLVFTVVSLLILPWMLALGLVNHLFDAYRTLSFVQFAVPFLFGAGWGVAQVLFGISVARLGLGSPTPSSLGWAHCWARWYRSSLSIAHRSVLLRCLRFSPESPSW